MREPRVRVRSVAAGAGLVTLCVCLVAPAGAQSDDDSTRKGSFSGQALIGYRSVDLDLEYTSGTGDVDANLRFSGPYLGLMLSF